MSIIFDFKYCIFSSNFEMSRKTYYQSGTYKQPLPSVHDGEAKKQQQKRVLAKQAKLANQEQLVGQPLPNIPGQLIGNGEFIEVPSDPMDVDEPYVPHADSTSFRYFNQQPAIQPTRYFQRDPIDAFLDPYSEPEYYIEESF